MISLWFKFLHNVISHPLLFITNDAAWCVRLHDWSKRRMAKCYKKLEPTYMTRCLAPAGECAVFKGEDCHCPRELL